VRLTCRIAVGLVAFWGGLCAWAAPQQAGPAAGPARGAARASAPLVRKGDGNVFDFQTLAMQGTIRLDGAYHGVSRLVDRQTGKQLIDTRYSALNLFKLMSVNQALGMPRTMDRTVRVSSDWVEVHWAVGEGHQGQLTARYEVREPNAVDVTVTVRCQGAYRGYEVFMSSYFDKGLRPHVYLQPRDRAQSAEPDLVLPTLNDVFRGTVLVFPRDSHAARRCLDGRWDRSERGTPTVQMCPVRRFAHCLAFLADAENRVAAVVMSDPRHCYALSTRYHADDDWDRLTDYSAADLSLLGDDLRPGDERTATVRLAVMPLEGDLSRPLGLYREFLSETAHGWSDLRDSGPGRNAE